jgi:hypothetical protein
VSVGIRPRTETRTDKAKQDSEEHARTSVTTLGGHVVAYCTRAMRPETVDATTLRLLLRICRLRSPRGYADSALDSRASRLRSRKVHFGHTGVSSKKSWSVSASAKPRRAAFVPGPDAARVAIESDAPVVPVGLDGFRRRHKAFQHALDPLAIEFIDAATDHQRLGLVQCTLGRR